MQELVMAEKDVQVQPLAPADYQLRSEHEDHETMSKKSNLGRRQRLYIQCCGCLTVLLVVPVVMIIVVLILFHVKNPVIRMNSVSIQRPLRFGHGNTSHDDQNMTLLVDVSVTNPNYASFKYGNATTVVYHDVVVVGGGQIPAGLAKARQTLQINITVDVAPEKVLRVQSFSDSTSGTLNMSSYTRIDGTVKMLTIVKKNVLVQLNCTFTYNIWDMTIHDNCRPYVKLWGHGLIS